MNEIENFRRLVKERADAARRVHVVRGHAGALGISMQEREDGYVLIDTRDGKPIHGPNERFSIEQLESVFRKGRA